MSSTFARCRPTIAGRVLMWMRACMSALPVLALALAVAAPAAMKPLLILGAQRDASDKGEARTVTPRFVLYSEGVAIYRSGGTAGKPEFRLAQMSAEQMKLFQAYMDDFFLNPEFADGFDNKAAGDLGLSFTIEARYGSGAVEIPLGNIRMEEMAYFGSQLRVNDSLAQVPVSLVRLLSLVRQIECAKSGKLVRLPLDEQGNPLMPAVPNASPGLELPRSHIKAPPFKDVRKPDPIQGPSPAEFPKVEEPAAKPEQPAPLVAPESYRR